MRIAAKAFEDGFVFVFIGQLTFHARLRKQLHRFLRRGAQSILVLSGDQLYVMDFRKILEAHAATDFRVVKPRLHRDHLAGLQYPG